MQMERCAETDDPNLITGRCCTSQSMQMQTCLLYTSKVLEKNGYQVKSASDGAQALEVLDKEYIDLIIPDIMMPVMDGYELVLSLIHI